MEPRRSNSHPATSVIGAGNGSLLSTILTVVLIVAALIAILYAGTRLAAANSGSGAVKGKQYQALFLSNGQVYFGHLKNVNSSYVKLNDIYYLQVQQQVQPGQQQNQNSQNQNVSLAKLGNELHGPEDSMYVSRDQVLFWENLKNDGKVAQAISQYKASGKK